MTSQPQVQAPKDHVFDPGDMASLPYQTDIDRRHCTRTVPLRVLCLGLSRTGTVSLRQALIQLGYKDCYHFASTLQENPRDAEMWIEALNAKFKGIGEPYGKDQWDALLGHCQAITDSPCVMFYKELLAAYPDAKVILTERDNADQWFRSQMSTVIPFSEKMLPQTWFAKFIALFSPVDSKLLRMMDLIVHDTPMYSALWHDHRNGTTTAKTFYEEYNAEIKRLVPKERLLVINAKEGWAPLCNFLSEDIPDTDFPHRNSKADFRANNGRLGEVMQTATRRNMTRFGTTVAAIVAVAALAIVKLK
jgi:hypothetical protein